LPYESGFLGILPTRKSTDDENLPGVGVRHVFAESPAAKAQIAPRDRILRFNKREVNDSRLLREMLGQVEPGALATIVYLRDGVEKTVEIQVASIPNRVPVELRSAAMKTKAVDEKEKAKGPKTGRFTVKMPNHERSYWAYVPDDYNSDYHYGLMVWIHPNGDTMEAAIFQAWKSLCNRRGIILLAPKSEERKNWALGDAGFVKNAVEEMLGKYTVDRERIFLHSYSSGNDFAFHLAFKFRELFRGVATVSSPSQVQLPENNPEYRLQVCFLCGEKDDSLPAVRSLSKQLQQMKYPVNLSMIENHDDTYSPPESVKELGRWADCLDRI